MRPRFYERARSPGRARRRTERIGHDDRRREGGRPPLRREVDDRGRQLVVEEHVAGQVAVDELASCVHRLEYRENVVELGKRQLAPGNAVAHRPRIRALVEDQIGAGCGRERVVEQFADGDDCAPASRPVRALDIVRGDPAVHDLRAQPCDTETVLRDRCEDVGLPRDLVCRMVERLEDEGSRAPRTAGAAGQDRGLAVGTERFEHARGWCLRRVHWRRG